MKRVILVEDEVEYQIHLAEALKSGDRTWFINNFIRGKSAVEFVKGLTTPPDIAVVDLGLSDMSGIDVIQEFHDQWPNMPILIFTSFPSAMNVREGLSTGARGYIVKDDHGITISTAIHEALVGHTPISPKIAGYLTCLMKQHKIISEDKPRLSLQEQKLLDMISAGNSYAVAAHTMGLKLSTVHAYSRNLFKKLNVNSKTQALIRAREFGLTQ